MKNKRCLILGGNGFIGKNLVQHLFDLKYEVTSFDFQLPKDKIQGVSYIVGDFSKDEDILPVVKKAELIIHLISTTNPGKSSIDPYSGYNIDVVQTIKILEVLKESGAKLIFASSGGTVYGEPEMCPINEEHKLSPISHYGIMKVTIENTIQMYNNVYSMKNIIMRISNPYGPGQDYTKGVGVIDAIIKKAINKETIEVWGDGENVRDYIYIYDLCHIVGKLCEYTGDKTIFNVGSGEGYSINQLINIVSHLLNEKLEVKYTNLRRNDIKNIYLDTELLCKELNIVNSISLKEGITKYIELLNERYNIG